MKRVNGDEGVRLAKFTVYTEGRTPVETCEDVLAVIGIPYK